MVVFASLALLLQPKIRELSGGGDRPGIYSAALFAVAVYGGYFGAGAGVIFLAATLILTSETVWRATILKSFFLALPILWLHSSSPSPDRCIGWPRWRWRSERWPEVGVARP
ncbi:hypothetical protein N806_25990 [Rhodococcus sp. P27]|nr:hypothetical protein N806_25990 [Rhodococcus sp. P27]